MEKGDFFTQIGDYHLAEEAYWNIWMHFKKDGCITGLANAQIIWEISKGKKISIQFLRSPQSKADGSLYKTEEHP